MDRRDFPSEAEYLRAHRAAFCLALEMGITPRAAELELKRRAQQECARRLAAKRDAAPQPGLAELRAGHDPDERPKPYWLRD